MMQVVAAGGEKDQEEFSIGQVSQRSSFILKEVIKEKIKGGNNSRNIGAR